MEEHLKSRKRQVRTKNNYWKWEKQLKTNLDWDSKDSDFKNQRAIPRRIFSVSIIVRRSLYKSYKKIYELSW